MPSNGTAFTTSAGLPGRPAVHPVPLRRGLRQRADAGLLGQSLYCPVNPVLDDGDRC